MDAPAEHPPVTLRDIAEKTGVSTATVSLALRNSPRISAETRARIAAAAKELGWRPNPLVGAYQTLVRLRKSTGVQAALAWINDHPEQDYWRQPWTRPLFEGARQRAAALGFALDEIWLGGALDPANPRENERKFSKILRARGINGLLLPWLCRPQHAFLVWRDFCVVCVGKHLAHLEHSAVLVPVRAQFHLVNEDDFANTRLAICRLREAGCRRVGLAISAWEDRHTDYLCSAAFLRAQAEWPPAERVPPLYSDRRDDVVKWLLKHRPDAVICSHGGMKSHVEAAGFRVPQDVRVAHLNLAADVEGWSGVDRRLGQIGSAAIDILTAHLFRNETGPPPFPKQMLIPGVWVEGGT